MPQPLFRQDPGLSDPVRDAELRTHNPRIFMEALVLGQEVELDGRTYKLFRDGEPISIPSLPDAEATETSLWTKAAREGRDGKLETVWLGADIGLAEFIRLAEAESVEAAAVVVSGTVLNRENRKKAKARDASIAERQQRRAELARTDELMGAVEAGE